MLDPYNAAIHKSNRGKVIFDRLRPCKGIKGFWNAANQNYHVAIYAAVLGTPVMIGTPIQDLPHRKRRGDVGGEAPSCTGPDHGGVVED